MLAVLLLGIYRVEVEIPRSSAWTGRSMSPTKQAPPSLRRTLILGADFPDLVRGLLRFELLGIDLVDARDLTTELVSDSSTADILGPYK